MQKIGVFAACLAVVCLVVSGCASTSTTGGRAQDIETARDTGSLDAFINGQMANARFPGLAACVVKNGKVVFSRAYGMADIEQQRPATPFTLFLLGSVAKTVTAAAVMHLQDQGRINLDEDINAYLPFAVRNPRFPAAAITPRMLLAHTSSIRDEEVIYGYLYTAESGGGDSPIALDVFIENYLSPGGDWYDPDQSFYADAPGTQGRYSNVGYALAGYLVEVVSGLPFNVYCQEHLFRPLGMSGASWFMRGLDPANVAMPYQYLQGIGHLPQGHYGYPTYPDGQLRVSVTQFGHFLAMMMSGGEYNGTRVLSRASVDEMMRVQYPEIWRDMGLGWWFGQVGGRAALGADGGDKGVCTTAFILADRSVAVAVFANGERTSLGERAMFAIQERLLAEAKNL